MKKKEYNNLIAVEIGKRLKSLLYALILATCFIMGIKEVHNIEPGSFLEYVGLFVVGATLLIFLGSVMYFLIKALSSTPVEDWE